MSKFTQLGNDNMRLENTFNLNIPIIVHEALTQDTEYYIETGMRQDMPGMDRINEPLTVGIPLSEYSGVTTVNQLGLNVVDLKQFRPLAYWSNGNIKWVLVDTQVNVLAEDETIIHLVDGTGNSGGTNLAVDNGEYISVDTETAQFRIKKSNFNMIDKAVVNGNEFVSIDNNGGLSITGHDNLTYTLNGETHVLEEGMTYDSKNDPDSTVVIEENGPVRTVVKAMGAFKDTNGNRMMDYTVRLHFYKGKSFIKSQVIMRHGQEEKHLNDYSKYGAFSQKDRKFSTMQVNIPLNLENESEFTFSKRNGSISELIDERAYVFQAFSNAHMGGLTEDDPIDGKTNWWYPPMETEDITVPSKNYLQKGLEIKNGVTVLNPLGDENDWTDGYAEIKDQSGNGVTIAMQYMSAYWPTSIEFSENGNVEIGVFSKYNSKKDIGIGWGTHETREIMLDFHTAPVDNTEVIYRLEQPIVGRNTIDHYEITRAFFGSNSIATEDEFNQFFEDNYGRVDYTHPKHYWQHHNSGVNVWRTFWYSGVQGNDHPLSELYVFITNGAGGRYAAGLQKTLFNTDSGIIRSDGFDYSHSLIKTSYMYPIEQYRAYNAGGGKNHFDYFGHNHWRAMPYFYYLTGNEEIKDAINDYLEEIVRKGTMNLFESSGVSLRAYSRFYSTIALGYEFTKDGRLKSILEDMTGQILDSRDNPPDIKPYGRNIERGYMWLDGSYYTEQIIHSFFLMSIHTQDTWQAYRVLKESFNITYPRIEELNDYLLGLGQFIYNEPFFMEPDGDDFGYTYDYYINSLNEWIPGGYSSSGNYMRKDDSSRIMLHAYHNTGDMKYLDRGKKILAFGGGTGSSTPFPANDLICADIHGMDGFWGYLNDISVVNDGSNNYTLTWVVPEGTVAYKIKYSDKPIIDWLGFDQLTREYEFSPDDYIAFFAATNIDNNPIPVTAGTEQNVVIDIEQAITDYNTIRELTPDNPSYVTYDPEKLYYFEIKYYRNANTSDPCEGVVCNNVCVGFDLWSQKCNPATGNCVTDQLIESNSATCGQDPCVGVVCDNICIGKDLWSQKCNPATGNCVTDQLIESNSATCGYDPCGGVVCENICIDKDLWSQKCVDGICVPDQLLESNSTTCGQDPCEGVVCENVCVGDDLWSQSCNPDTGLCEMDQLLQQDSITCTIPDRLPTDESTIQTYLILGGLGLAALVILMAGKKS